MSKTSFLSCVVVSSLCVWLAGCGGASSVTPSGSSTKASPNLDANTGEPSHQDFGADQDQTVLRAAPQWQQPLTPVLEQAAEDYGVPLDLLVILGKLGSGFENRGDAPTIEGGYGVMALRDNDLGGDSLLAAARLLGVSRDEVVSDPVGNIRGAAAILDQYASGAGVDRAAGIEAWLPVVVKYAGLDEEDSKFFAVSVYGLMQVGLDYANSYGERFVVDARSIAIDLDALVPADMRKVPVEELEALTKATKDNTADKSILPKLLVDYPGATWDPAASCNFSTTISSKDTVIIHTIEGTAAGARSWFKNCASQVSSHYVVSEAGGVWQMVLEQYKAWHVGCLNLRSVGIEHEGYAASSSHPATLYNASALLSRNICDRRGIAKAHHTCPPGILGHVDANTCVCGPGHTDPGAGWDWGYYINQVVGVPSLDSAFNNQSYVATMHPGDTAIVWVEYRNTGSSTWQIGGSTPVHLGTWNPQDRSSAFYTAGNWLGPNRPTEMDVSTCAPNAICRFTFIMTAPSTPGVYTEYWRLVQENVAWFGYSGVWFQVTVTDTPPTITGQPSAQTVCSGSNASFSVSASGSNLAYQWQKNGVNVANGGKYSGATSPTLSVTGATSGEAGNYHCVVSNSGGSVTSSDAALTIRAATTITQQPSSQTICTGGSATFTVAATGDGTLTYQWQKDSVNIGGATAASYQVTGATSGSAGSYQCIVTGGCGSASSSGASLTVNGPPSITQQPSSQSVAAFGSTSFTVAASGTGLSYQWQKNGVNLANGGHVSGATATTLQITSAATSDVGTYACVVTGSCGSTTSGGASLSLQAILVDDFETYASQVAFEALWLDTANSAYFLDSALGNPGKSVNMPSPSANSLGKYYRNLGGDYLGSDASPVVMSLNFYLDVAGSPNWSGARHYVELRGYAGNAYNSGSLENLVAIGVNNTSNDTFSTTKYQGRVVNGANWVTLDQGSAPSRQSGWHQLKIEVASSQVRFYVDNVLSETQTRPNALGFDCVVIGSDLTANGHMAAVDNLVVSGGP